MSRVRTAALVVAVLLIALNLRPAVVAVSPLLAQIRADLGIGGAVAGLITTLPVLCFGLLAPFAGRLARRIGLETALLRGAARPDRGHPRAARPDASRRCWRAASSPGSRSRSATR